MPTFSEIAKLIALAPKGTARLTRLNKLRLKYMQDLAAFTKRPLLVYASNTEIECGSAMVDDLDMRALMDTFRGMSGDHLDLILHSNGGSPDAADMFVAYLREKFKHIRLFVPQQAMSAATMIACGANEWVLARHSFLGPIDLQLHHNGAVVAAQEVLDQYGLIRREITDGTKFWTGAGDKYFPTLLIRCQNALEYGREVAERHLRDVMFHGQPQAGAWAKQIAADLANHQKHKMHGRRLSRRYLRELNPHLNITDLERDQHLQDLVLTVHHCIMHTFEMLPPLSKLMQNSLGKVVPTFSPAEMMRGRAQGFDIDPLYLRQALEIDDEVDDDETEDDETEDDETEDDETGDEGEKEAGKTDSA